jgi:hypothetical protein
VLAACDSFVKTESVELYFWAYNISLLRLGEPPFLRAWHTPEVPAQVEVLP